MTYLIVAYTWNITCAASKIFRNGVVGLTLTVHTVNITISKGKLLNIRMEAYLDPGTELELLA
jgi:hypothetical protein